MLQPTGLTRSLLVVRSTARHPADLLTTQRDLDFIAGLEFNHGGVAPAHQQVAVERHFGGVAQLAAPLASAAAASADRHNLIAALLLGGVHRLVGPGDQLVRRFTGTGQGHAYADADLHQSLRDRHRFAG